MTAKKSLEEGKKFYYSQDYEKAIVHFTEAIRLNPDESISYKYRGSAKCNLHWFSEAILDFDKAIRLDPDDAISYRNRGSAKYDLQRYQEAIWDYNEAIRLDPDDAISYKYRGDANHKLQCYQEAIWDYDEAIRLNPDETISYEYRGDANYKLQHYQEAIWDYDKAIKCNPDDARSYHNRGLAKSKLERFREAIQDYDNAIKFAHSSLLYNNRGFAKYNLQRYQEAILDFDKAIRLDPDDAIAYNNRGNAQNELQRYRKAMKDYDEAIRLDPRYALPWEGKGIIYDRENNTAGAKSHFIRSVYLGLGGRQNFFFFLDKHPVAPFLAMRLIQEEVPTTEYGRIAKLIHITFSQTTPLYSFIINEKLLYSTKYTDSEWYKWLGIINYYMGDPITAFRLLSDLADRGSQDLIVFYYLILSCFDFEENPTPHIAKAIEIAERVKWQKQKKEFLSMVKFTEEQLLQYYYAGHIFLLDEELDDAIECFLKIHRYFLPAAYMPLLIWHEKEELSKRDSIKKEIIKREVRSTKHGFINGLKSHNIDFKNDSLHQPFAHYFHYFEISPAIKIFADIAQKETLFRIESPYNQKPFYELFRISSASREDIRRRLSLRKLLNEWEDSLQINKETVMQDYEILNITVTGRTMKSAFKEFLTAAKKGNIELVMGEYIEEFSLKPEQYKNLLNYFYVKGHLTEYQKLLLHFYILDQTIKNTPPSKIQLSGLKDGVKKIVYEGLSDITQIMVGGTISGLPFSVALALGTSITIAKGSLGELFVEYYQRIKKQPSFTYSQFRSRFENYISEQKERLGIKFEKLYPIDELYQVFPISDSTNSE